MSTYYTPGSEAEQFVDEVESNGLVTEHYYGRFFYEGPAVRVDELQDAIRATSVKVQWDSMGAGYIVYPRHGDPGTSETGKHSPAEFVDEDEGED
jgi:hypothetical protein